MAFIELLEAPHVNIRAKKKLGQAINHHQSTISGS
jgi:hypothetical protein